MSHDRFHPVIRLPEEYEIYDFSRAYEPNRTLKFPFGIGRYDEKRPGMYTDEIFTKEQRCIHMGIDIGCPVGTSVHAFDDGEIFLFGYNPAPGDYGYTLITRHELDGQPIYALHGHLAEKSIAGRKEGQAVQRGEVIAWVGDKHENGGWNPHLHFQLSVEKPKSCDMPGVVSEADREKARVTYPDPRIVLGPLY